MPAKLIGFSLALVAVFAASFGVGAAVGPIAGTGDDSDHRGHGDMTSGGAREEDGLPAPSSTATIDGYTVTMRGALIAGEESDLTFSVSREGKAVTDLQPYLGAYGHLVALRVGDLAYLHVRPEGAPDDGRTRPGPDVAFRAEVPAAGSHRLFLDFQHGGVVRTAEFTVVAAGASS